MNSGNIFISYRREDAGWVNQAIYKALTEHFSPEQVFMDIDSIDLGNDFVDALEEAVAKCDVMLVLIGKDWAEPSTNGIRLQNPYDFVHIEVAVAIKRNIRIIPVLIDDAQLPSVEVLPEPLRPLIRRQVHRIKNPSFSSDIKPLIEAIGRILGAPGNKNKSPSDKLSWALRLKKKFFLINEVEKPLLVGLG